MSLRPYQFSRQDRGALYHLNPKQVIDGPVPAQGDALSSPDADVMAPSLHELLPRGAAWGTPDNAAFDASTRLGLYLRGISGQLAALYQRMFRLSQESSAVTTGEGFEDWEAEYGLPDPCFGDFQSFEKRRRALILRVRGAGTITVSDYLKLAREAGYTVTIEEPQPFEAGISECGVDSWEVSGDKPVEYFWIVKVAGVAVDYFHAGQGEAGVTPLTELSLPSDLICLFRSLAPAWTQPIFGA